MSAVRPGYRWRALINIVNLSTPLGMMLGIVGRARLHAGPDGLILGYGYRIPFPPAPAFTLGNVVLFRGTPEILERRPALLAHESRHATQYAYCLGVVMPVLYGLAAGWSWILTGDPASRNIFEIKAGLRDGGYKERPVRKIFRRVEKEY